MRTLNIPLTLGRADRVDPKFAPLGVVATAKNLRVRKDGRLVSRNGYERLSAATVNGTMVAYDVTSYRQRLVALASDGGDGYPVDAFEFVNAVSSAPWRATDSTNTQRVMVNPLTNWREVCGIPQPDSGMSAYDVASGNGYVCTAYKPVGSSSCFYQVVRESNDQVVVAGRFATPAFTNVKVAFASGSFWFVGPLSDNSVSMCRFTPGTDTTISAPTSIDALSANPVTAFEVREIRTPSTGITIVAIARAAATTITIKRWTSTMTQDGTTNTVAVAAVWVDVEADAGNNTVNLTHVVGTSTNSLRTYNFANALTLGPTVLTVGRRSQVARCFNGVTHLIATATNTETGSVSLQWWDQTTHGVIASQTIFEAQMSTRLQSAASSSQSTAVIFGGWVEPRLAVAGAAFNADSFPTNALFWATFNMFHMSTRDLSESSRFLATNRMGLSIDSSNSRAAWCSTYSFELDQIDHPSITCFDYKNPRRRQSAEYGGALYLAGSCPSIYDGHVNTEVGFNEIPGIQSITPSIAAGALASNASYIYVVHWEYQLPDGSVYQSPVSLPFTGNTGASQNTNTLLVTTPHSLRVVLGSTVFGSDVSLAVFRTEWNATTSTIGGTFKRVQTVSLPNTVATYGQTVSVIDTMSDATLASQAPVYTQADRGPINAPLQHNAPDACSYISASSARLLTGAMARPYEFQESNESFLGEPINFCRFPNFFGKASSEINGVVSLDGVRLICSRERIYACFGQGPDDTGAGALPSPVELPSPAGLLDWKSLLVAPDGVYMQIFTNQLYRVPRDGGSPEWVGVDVQDTLTAYPSITGAGRIRQDDAVAFACVNSGATDARIVVRSLRTGLWLEDTPPLEASRGIEAMCEFGDSTAYVSGGRVYVLSTTGGFSDTTSTVIPTQIKTHPLYPFELAGYGTMHSVLLTGEFRSAGTLTLRVSYDDGVSFTTYDNFVLTGLTVGQTVQRKWALQQSEMTSVVFEWTFTPSVPGEGFIMHSAGLLVDPQPGQLRELDPSEMA